MNRFYSDDFKLKVVLDYYESPLGVRTISRKYNLPAKNYVNNWEKQLIRKGLLPEGSTKPNKSVGRSPDTIAHKDSRTEREKQYEHEISKLKAEIGYFESLDHIKPFITKKNEKSD